MGKRACMSSKAMNFWDVWGDFKTWCEEVPGVPKKYQPLLYATKGADFRWVIGPYCLLTEVAQSLRWDESRKSCRDAELEEALADFGVRYGARVGDVAPQRSPLNKCKADLTKKPEKVTADQRRESDMFPKLKEFWAGKTLEVHHIVEKGIFKVLKLNTKGSPLDNEYAPCVLAFAEVHRCLLTPHFCARQRPGRGRSGDPRTIQGNQKPAKRPMVNCGRFTATLRIIRIFTRARRWPTWGTSPNLSAAKPNG
jgi:hypothetical protein